MKNRFGIFVLSCLLFTFAHAAQHPFQRAEMTIHPITGDSVRVFDILVRIDSADVDGLVASGEIPEIVRPALSYTCNSELRTGREFDVSWHPTGVCYQLYIEETFKLFADWLYEATNGKHLLGKVYFVRDYVDSSYVDVEWISNRGSSGTGPGYFETDEYGRRGSNSWASVGAWGIEKGGRIALVHRDRYNGNKLSLPVNLASTMTHEWGHYTLGLNDEYTGDDGYTIIDPEKYRNLLVDPDKPITTPVNGSEWRLNDPNVEISRDALRWFNNIDSASYVLSRTMSEAPSLMYHQWVTGLGDEGSMRYANLSTDYMHCEEGAEATTIGHCTPKTFYGEYGGAKIKREYQLTESAWGKISKPGYRWPELASVAPTYNDRDPRGNRYVKMDSTSAEIMRAFLELDWSLWNADTSSLSFSRTILFLVDLSKYASEEVQWKMLRALEVATLFAKNVPGVNIGLEATGAFGKNHISVPIGRAAEVADDILSAIGQLKFDDPNCASQELLRPCDFMDSYLGIYGIDVLKDRPTTERKHLVFLTSGHLRAMGFVSWQEIYGSEMEDAGIRLHVENFLDSVGQLPETFSASRPIRMSSGSSAYNIADKPETEADNLVMFLSNALGVRTKRIAGTESGILSNDNGTNGGTRVSAKMLEECSAGWMGLCRADSKDNDDFGFEFYYGAYQYTLSKVRAQSSIGRLARDSSLRIVKMDVAECVNLVEQKKSPSFNTFSWGGGNVVLASGKTTAISRLYSPPGMSNLLPGEVLLLYYEIGSGALLTGISPRAEICDISRPEAKCDTVFLRDDGINGDDYAGDGRYVLQWRDYNTCGPFRVEVVVDTLPPGAHWVAIEGGAISEANPDEFTGESALFHFAVLGEVENGDTSVTEPVLPRLKVLARDHHFGHPQISVLSFKVENVGEMPLEGGMLHYFFTMPEATPYLLDYYTPDFDPQVVNHGDGRYELRMQLFNDLTPGAVIPEWQENQLHLRGTNYETLNVLDDWSNPKSVTFVETDSVVVTDKNGTIVHGVAPEWWTTGGVQ